jgi:hypothetical protein
VRALHNGKMQPRQGQLQEIPLERDFLKEKVQVCAADRRSRADLP